MLNWENQRKLNNKLNKGSRSLKDEREWTKLDRAARWLAKLEPKKLEQKRL